LLCPNELIVSLLAPLLVFFRFERCATEVNDIPETSKLKIGKNEETRQVSNVESVDPSPTMVIVRCWKEMWRAPRVWRPPEDSSHRGCKRILIAISGPLTATALSWPRYRWYRKYSQPTTITAQHNASAQVLNTPGLSSRIISANLTIRTG
jgi:hypothetical protein